MAAPFQASRSRRPASEFVSSPVLAAVHGEAAGAYELVLPRDARELREWSVRLQTCLDTYVGAVRSRRTWVIGVRQAGRLVAAAEIDPLRRKFVQFTGVRNQRVAAEMLADVSTRLRELGVLR